MFICGRLPSEVQVLSVGGGHISYIFSCVFCSTTTIALCAIYFLFFGFLIRVLDTEVLELYGVHGPRNSLKILHVITFVSYSMLLFIRQGFECIQGHISR
jgi:hypothetical protein